MLTLSSFSKTLAPGYRVGWIAPGRHRDQVLAAQMMCSFACGTTPQLAIAEFLEEGGYDHHLRGLRRELQERRHRLIDAAARHFPEGTTLTNPPGGFILWAQFPAAMEAMELHRQALKAGLSIAPGPLFTPGGNYRTCARLSAAFMRPGTEAHVAKLGELAGRLAG